MPADQGLYRTKLPNGTDVAYVDKGQGKTIGLTRESYEQKGYQPDFEALPEQ